MSNGLSPDPSLIGGVPEAPFAIIPDPETVFATRARRFAFLAESGNLGGYLRFLGELARVQADLLADLPPVSTPHRAGMPPIDRKALAGDAALDATLTRLCAAAKSIDMPEAARAARQAVTSASPADRAWMFLNLAKDHIPADATAPHLFAAAAFQLHLSLLAATLAANDLTPLGTGICPACGGKPVTSSVIANETVENVRYCTCATCATQWNEVRIKCQNCGSTKGISYRSAETQEATVKAECCSECQGWLKILYQVKNPSLDPVADDVASLGLDLMMRETGLKRAGFHPFLAGF
ncbi:MAG TPA: formate dehydrogenase accessory protein FdhE [Albidovulum sp.]|uniref:formate dehydrogenase accessory protein FdhE n=1 Tax=Albidovulum sp. TaxID=1872424 RepID=UPI002B7AD1D6|nr:formate dehydrogenase accessory protein FdhE [Albidovulum sp.]